MASLTCSRCGADIADGARFCSACGTPAEHVLDERRIVTVIFADLTGFTQLSESLDPEHVKRIIDRTFARLGVVVERYGGRVDKVIGDELMAVFGAPSSHEDDPERAVRCAFAMRAELEAMGADPSLPPLAMHIGVNTGEVVAGTVGGRDYTILGDAVNTARRIQEAAASGQILVGETTCTLTEHAIAYRSLDAVDAKGKALPIPVAEAVGERGLPGRVTFLETPLIGRREEMHLIALAGMLAERDRRCYAVTIVGDAGMGKSKLAAEISAEAQRRRLTVLGGRALPYATVSAGFALEQVLRGALDLDEAGDELAGIRERLATLDLAAETDVVAAFLGIEPDPAQTSTGGAPGAGAVPTIRRAAEASVRVLVQRARRDGLLVCVLNDLQWAEPIVLEALDLLVRTADAPILVVALARPMLLDEPPGYLAAAGSLLLPLAPLPPDRAAEILDVLAPGVPGSVRDEIVARAGGNPFFLEELARLARDAPEELATTVPATVHALVTTRLDRLPSDEKRLLQLASLSANIIAIDALAALSGRTPETLEAIVERLLAAGFLEPRGEGLRFRQKLVREVAYASMPKQQRVEAHEQHGRWLLEQPGATADEIAYTFERAVVLPRELNLPATDAATYGREALIALAERALARDAATTARELFERAIALTGEPLPVGPRIGYGAALLGVLERETADAELHAALGAARAADDRRNVGRALRLIGDSLRIQSRFEDAGVAIEEAIAIARELGATLDLIEAERARGLLDLFRGDYRGAFDTFRLALERAQEQGDLRAQGWALQNLGWTSMIRGRQTEAIEAFTRGEALFERLDDQEGRGWCMGMRAWSLLMTEQVDASVALMSEVEHLVTDRFPGDAANLVMARRIVHVLHSYVAIARGDLLGAERMCREILVEPEWHGLSWAHALAAYPLALSALLQARAETAADAIARGLEAVAEGNDPFYRGLYRVASAWLALLRGRLEEAAAELEALAAGQQAGHGWLRSGIVIWLRARLDGTAAALNDAVAVLSEPGRTEGITVLPRSSLLADLAVALLETDPAAATAAVDAARREVGGFAVGRIDALLAAARIALATGDRDEALAAVTDAIDALGTASYPIASARAHALLAEILDARREHDRADEAFERAKALAEELPPDTLPDAWRPLRL